MNPERIAADVAREWEIGERLKLMLTYEGPLPSSGNSGSRNRVKNHIRRRIHPQLFAFCKGDMGFIWIASPTSGGKPLGGIRFVPVIRRNFAVELGVEILRRDRPGGIFNGGDLDGRIKTLFDGLRVPHHESETHGFTPTGDPNLDWCLCLLEDDSLITRVAIDTHELFRPLREGENKTDVEVRIDITITRPTSI